MDCTMPVHGAVDEEEVLLRKGELTGRPTPGKIERSADASRVGHGPAARFSNTAESARILSSCNPLRTHTNPGGDAGHKGETQWRFGLPGT